LARNLVPISVPKGSAVITQGETGDRFYAILEGTVEVLVDGRPLTTLGPGGSFGEIALIRDLPRTATVIAKAESVLLALDRDEFLRAIVGHEDTSDAAHGLATERLDELESRRDG